MTVLELIEKLRHCDPALEVLCFAESADGSTSPFEIDAVSVCDVEKGRDVQGHPAIKFGASKSARPVVVIEITADA